VKSQYWQRTFLRLGTRCRSVDADRPFPDPSRRIRGGVALRDNCWPSAEASLRRPFSPTGYTASPRRLGRVFLATSGHNFQDPIRKRDSSGPAVIQVSTSAGVVRITGITFGWMAPTSAFGSIVRKAKMSLWFLLVEVQIVSSSSNVERFEKARELSLLLDPNGHARFTRPRRREVGGGSRAGVDGAC
jgi:hypothetical protein